MTTTPPEDHDQDADPPLTDGEGPQGPHPDPPPGGDDGDDDSEDDGEVG